MATKTELARLERACKRYSDEKLLLELRTMLMYGAPASSKLILYAEVKRRGLEL